MKNKARPPRIIAHSLEEEECVFNDSDLTIICHTEYSDRAFRVVLTYNDNNVIHQKSHYRYWSEDEAIKTSRRIFKVPVNFDYESLSIEISPLLIH